MLSLAIAVVISASIMRAVSTLVESRFKPQYFTRKRKMPFHDLLKYLLSMHRTSTQSALNNFFERNAKYVKEKSPTTLCSANTAEQISRSIRKGRTEQGL